MHVAQVVKSFTRATILKKILRNCEKYINIYTYCGKYTKLWFIFEFLYPILPVQWKALHIPMATAYLCVPQNGK